MASTTTIPDQDKICFVTGATGFVALNLIDDLAENCLMIGDNFIADISGAKNVGMNAIHFNSNNEEYHDICPIIYSYNNIYELINKF